MSHVTYTVITVVIASYAIAAAIALVRVLRGPSAQDRIFALDFIYVNGMLAVLVLGIRYASQMYLEAALLVALFGFLTTLAMAKFLLRGEVIE